MKIRKSILAAGSAFTVAATLVATPAAMAEQTRQQKVDQCVADMMENFPAKPEKMQPKPSATYEDRYNGTQARGKSAANTICENRQAILETGDDATINDNAKAQSYVAEARRRNGELANRFDAGKNNMLSAASERSDATRAARFMNNADSDFNFAVNDGEVISKLRKAIDAAGFTYKCENSVNGDEAGKGIQDWKLAFNSSAQRSIYDNGKKKCVNNGDYVIGQIKEIGTILTAVVGVITTLASLQSVVMKAIPKPAKN